MNQMKLQTVGLQEAKEAADQRFEACRHRKIEWTGGSRWRCSHGVGGNSWIQIDPDTGCCFIFFFSFLFSFLFSFFLSFYILNLTNSSGILYSFWSFVELVGLQRMDLCGGLCFACNERRLRSTYCGIQSFIEQLKESPINCVTVGGCCRWFEFQFCFVAWVLSLGPTVVT